MAHITTTQRMVHAKIIKLVTTCDEHKQKIQNEIDMQRDTTPCLMPCW